MLEFLAAINEYPWTTLFVGLWALAVISEWRS